MEELRMDKFIWAVRLFKTRSQAAEALKQGQVLVNEQVTKASAPVKIDQIIKVKRNPIWRSYRVKALLHSRVGAKLVEAYIEECTPASELHKLEMMKLTPGFEREKGLGRPTKKERRDLDQFESW